MPGPRAATLACILAGTSALGLHAQSSYSKIGEIAVGGAASFDYLNVDSANKRLYLTHGTEVVVIDTAANAVVGRIPAGPRVHGIAIAPNGRGYITNGGEDTVSIVDLKTLEVIAKVSTDGPDASITQNPDAVLYEPKRNEVYAFNHTGKSATVIDAATGKAVAQIPLTGVAESGQADPALGRVFVNIEDTSAIDVIDVASHKVIATWPIAPAETPRGMGIDVATHRLFVGGGATEVMMDAASGKILATAPICSGSDATWFEPGTNRVFSSCGGGSGSITVVHVEGPDRLSVVQTIETVRGARTMALDPATHKLYVAGQKYQPADPNAAPPPAGARGRGGPPAVPDSFHVLVLGIR